MVIASSISGLPIYAPSAAFAPTNSAEVSAIASAYQVVSSTATQLYAGTAYVTSVNDAPLSASRAGNAANASLASSAWYDGTGRLISALPDEATVSAIASSYAESAASGKLDASESSNYYPTSNPSGFISSVDLSDYATTAYVDSSISGFAYNSAVSGWTAKQDALTFGYDTADKISGINGSALAGEGGGMVTAIGTSTSGITSINNSGLVDTAALHSADYSSLYVQEPLYISASGDSSYIGISGDVGGVDSATCSAIASAYAESAVSAASSNYYPATSNPSGYLTAQAQASWSESASASPSYIQDKPDLVDIVAGPGIIVDNPDGNTLRVSMADDYETVLWDKGTGNALGDNVASAQLSEALSNFKYVRFEASWNVYLQSTNRTYSFVEKTFKPVAAQFAIDSINGYDSAIGSTYLSISRFGINSAMDNVTFLSKLCWLANNTSTTLALGPTIDRIVGINRIANN